MNSRFKNTPHGAEEYFIDYDGSVCFLKENRDLVYTNHLGWEKFDLNYQEKVKIHPLRKIFNGIEFVAYYGVEKAKELRGNTLNALLDMGHYKIHVNDIDEALKMNQ